MRLRFEPLRGDPEYKNNSSKSKKVLTNRKAGLIIKGVHKNIKERTNKMSNDKKNSKGFDTVNAVKSIAWLIEAGFRAFVGWVLLSNFDTLVTVAAAIYALGTAGIIVVTHFVRANRK